MKVLGMGNALVDLLAKIDNDAILNKLGLPKGSMTLIDEIKFHEFSEVFKTMDTTIVSGGSASNTIIGISSLGLYAGFIGRVGDDMYGKVYKNDLSKYDVCPHLIEVDELSGVASTFISKDGERTFGTYLGAAAKLSADDLSIDDFVGYDYFYIEGYLVQNYELIEKAVKFAKEAGLKVALDLASYNIVEESLDFLLSIIPNHVDIIFANEEEAKAMTNLEPEKAVSEIAKLANLAVVKTGYNGSWVQQGEIKIHIPANKVKCLDSTGAGDLYAAGFIYGLIKNKDLKICAQIGTLLAGEVIQEIGPKIADERWDELKSIIAKL